MLSWPRRRGKKQARWNNEHFLCDPLIVLRVLQAHALLLHTKVEQ